MISWVRSHIFFIVAGLVLAVMILRSTASIIPSLGMSAFFIIPTIVSTMKWIAEISLVLVTYLTSGYIQLYNTSVKKTVVMIRRKIKYSSMTCDGKSEGYFVGYEGGGFFCGFIEKKTDFRGDTITLYILTTRNIYEKLTESGSGDHDTVVKKKIFVDFWERDGSRFNPKYDNRSLDFTDYQATREQERVIKKIVELYKSNKSLALLFYGIPGTGKTLTAVLLAKILDASFCTDWKPTDPNNHFRQIYLAVAPIKEKPLIVVLEEGDKVIERIFKELVKQVNDSTIQMREKSDWNSFLDYLSILYPNTIFIITSNMTPEEIIAVTDQSSIRHGRITAQYRFTEKCH